MLAYKENGRWREWHVNESAPDFQDRVATLQVDGDELYFLLLCMEQIGFDKPQGVLHVRVPRCPKCGTAKLTGECGHTWEIPGQRK